MKEIQSCLKQKKHFIIMHEYQVAKLKTVNIEQFVFIIKSDRRNYHFSMFFEIIYNNQKALYFRARLKEIILLLIDIS